MRSVWLFLPFVAVPACFSSSAGPGPSPDDAGASDAPVDVTIPSSDGAPDASAATPEASSPEAGAAPDASGSNATVDAAPDAGPEASTPEASTTDAATDGARDAQTDGGPVQITAGDGYNVLALRVHGSYLYWMTSADIWRVALGGGSPAVVVPGLSGPNGFAVDDANVYWTAGSSLLSAPITGIADAGAAFPIAQSAGSGLGDIAVTSTTAYFASGVGGSGAILAAPLGGGTVVTFSGTANQPAPGLLATDGTNVYWSDNSGSVGTFYREPIGGVDAGGPVLIGQAPAPPYLAAIDTTSIYWTDFASVYKDPLAGSAVVATPLASGFGQTESIAVDSTGVYVGTSGQVVTFPIDGTDGGAVTVLAANVLDAKRLAIDSTWVYYADNQGMIWAVPK